MTADTEAVPNTQNLRAQGLAILRRLVGRADADFHPGQWEAIEALVAHNRRALVVQRTGWGKSAVYFVATLLQRAMGSGPTLIVSPLIALMRDQVAAATRWACWLLTRPIASQTGDTTFVLIIDAFAHWFPRCRSRFQYSQRQQPQTRVSSRMWPSKLPPALMMCSSYVGH